jgi:MSHA biogenesis protein MshJ
MKQYWQKTASRIDALSLRERAIIFAMIVVLVITVVNMAFLDPLFANQKQLSGQLQAEQAQISRIQNEIRAMVKVQNDPDQANRERLQALRQQHVQMHSVLLDMQKGLVTPDKMTVLLEDILRQDGRLRLLSLKTLPATSLGDPVAADAKPGADKTTVSALNLPKAGIEPAVSGAVYKHGVEIVVQGSYLDMLNYMVALEAMPWQLFWGKARLTVEEYPKATLTLTLFTLSLDKRWLNL